MKDEIVKLLLKNINLEGIAFDLLDNVLEKALRKVVEDTSNPFDDMLMSSVYPILEQEIKDLISEKVRDLAE